MKLVQKFEAREKAKQDKKFIAFEKIKTKSIKKKHQKKMKTKTQRKSSASQ